MRFYDPQRGRITINGVDIRTMPLDELRSLIGYVQQDIFLFAGDIATNIRLSNPISDEEVAHAAAEVGADRIIRGFPQGYGQVLGERGASISVGERQLLSFARAIAANAPLLLLDEATSAVDREIEAEIQAIARESQQPIEQVRSVLTKEGGERSIANRLRNRKALDLLVENAQVIDEEWHEEKDEG